MSLTNGRGAVRAGRVVTSCSIAPGPNASLSSLDEQECELLRRVKNDEGGST